jgi:drug/metabolite transporter (DMT)-like permease
MISKTIRQIQKANKLRRYKIGLLFYIVYNLVDTSELVLTEVTKYDYQYDPFCEVYLRHSAFIAFLLLVPFTNKKNSYLFDIMSITKYYIPDWKKKKNGNLSTMFYVFEGTEEKFNKTVHKISFLLTVLFYFSMSFYMHSFVEASRDNEPNVIPILFPMGSVIIIIFLRKYFLHTQSLDLLSIISVILISISVLFLTIYQYTIFENKNPLEIFGFSLIGGVLFGFFSTFLKYYSNLYNENFKLSTIFGYIGVYTLITVTLIICLICLFDDNLDEKFNLFSQGNNVAVYIILFICAFIKNFCIFHCIISLSPLIFSISIFFILFLNQLINIIWGFVESEWTFYVAGVFLVLGVAGGILDKYLKHSIKVNKIKKNDDGGKIENKNSELNFDNLSENKL